ncbi:MAG: hypothetical protein EXQ97_06400 [Alphaproteobacteria bacterium]|nr:hypothetical protein [Alphaproteobacteria bacterium]
MRGIVGELWWGGVPLGRAFWDHMLLRGTLINIVASIAALILLSADASNLVIAIFHFATVPWNFVLFVAVWRAAVRYEGPPQRANAARLAAAAWFVAALAV